MTRTEVAAGRRARGAARRGLPAALAAAALSLGLGACSAVPDWADPTDWFAKDQKPTTISAPGAEEADNASFPNLASVPTSRPEVTSKAARSELRQSLAADRANAEYSGQHLTGQAAAPETATAEPAGAPPVPQISAGLSGARARPAQQETGAQARPMQQEAGAQSAAPSAPALQSGPAVQSAQAVGAAAAAKPETQLRFPQFEKGAAAGAAPALAGHTELVAVIYFANGSAGLNADDRQILREVAALHRERGGGVRVVGHASARTATVDPVEHRIANFEISMRRADAVRAALVSLGVASDEVTAEAHGDTQPVYHEFMPTGEAGNRRAEIFLVY